MSDPGVSFPRTIPDNPPQPPSPLLDQRAARVLFEAQKRDDNAVVGYRLAEEGVYVQKVDGSHVFSSWNDVKAFAHEHADTAPDSVGDADPDPSRRERRQQRRRERRGQRGNR